MTDDHNYVFAWFSYHVPIYKKKSDKTAQNRRECIRPCLDPILRFVNNFYSNIISATQVRAYPWQRRPFLIPRVLKWYIPWTHKKDTLSSAAREWSRCELMGMSLWNALLLKQVNIFLFVSVCMFVYLFCLLSSVSFDTRMTCSKHKIWKLFHFDHE